MASIRDIGENIKNSQFFRGTVSYDVPLSKYTTMKVGGPASVFVEPSDNQSVAVVISLCKENNIRFFVFGGGSNLVVNDKGIEGVVISTLKLNEISISLGERVTFSDKSLIEEAKPYTSATQAVITCGAGTLMDDLASFCVKHGVFGLTNFAGLPGTAGGAAYMNARCYDKSISDVINSAQYIDFDEISKNFDFMIESASKVYNNRTIDWEYKHSPFMEKNVLITSVSFTCYVLDNHFVNKENANLEVQSFIQQKNDWFVNDRINKGHFKAPSSGSVFKNNRAYGKPSGVLIDSSGLKGMIVGGAQVAPWHANIIINTGSACAKDIMHLVKKVQEKVKSDTGFLLEPEIIFI